ncbi:hypothetical protein DFH09DRAFT_1198433, partial [Mycena vulgaris]
IYSLDGCRMILSILLLVQCGALCQTAVLRDTELWIFLGRWKARMVELGTHLRGPASLDADSTASRLHTSA